MTSKRDLERRLDDLEGNDGAIEEASIGMMLSSINTGEYDALEARPGLVRCSGQLYRVPDLPPGMLADLESDDE